jgi:hypothetical protein
MAANGLEVLRLDDGKFKIVKYMPMPSSGGRITTQIRMT